MSPQVTTRFSLREVAELTGLSEFTLRGWEGRYGAVTPLRTETGRRLYRTEDVVRLNLLRDLVALGHRIGDIAPLGEPRLRSLLSSPHSEETALTETPKVIRKIFEGGERFAWSEISRTLEKERNQRSGEDFLNSVLLPFLKELNRRIALGRISISLEHIYSSLMKEELARLRAHPHSRKKASSRFLLCTPEGDHHELGLLIAYTALSLRGISSLYLGPHVPKQELCETALRYGASHILLSSTLKHGEGPVEDPLKLVSFLTRHLPQFSQLWVAGRGFQDLTSPDSERVRHLQSFEALMDLLPGMK